MAENERLRWRLDVLPRSLNVAGRSTAILGAFMVPRVPTKVAMGPLTKPFETWAIVKLKDPAVAPKDVVKTVVSEVGPSLADFGVRVQQVKPV